MNGQTTFNGDLGAAVIRNGNVVATRALNKSTLIQRIRLVAKRAGL